MMLKNVGHLDRERGCLVLIFEGKDGACNVYLQDQFLPYLHMCCVNVHSCYTGYRSNNLQI